MSDVLTERLDPLAFLCFFALFVGSGAWSGNAWPQLRSMTKRVKALPLHGTAKQLWRHRQSRLPGSFLHLCTWMVGALLGAVVVFVIWRDIPNRGDREARGGLALALYIVIALFAWRLVLDGSVARMTMFVANLITVGFQFIAFFLIVATIAESQYPKTDIFVLLFILLFSIAFLIISSMAFYVKPSTYQDISAAAAAGTTSSEQQFARVHSSRKFTVIDDDDDEEDDDDG